MFRRNKGENKAKLEHKLYLARETPEPIFDLSECNLRNVPHGIYSLCKVFLKQELLLQHNCLNSLSGGGSLSDLCLLRVLNISHNAFSSLPDEISLLKNLQELYVNDNQLKKLPDSLCNMTNLRILDVSNNNLKQLPELIGNLVHLTRLSISGNKHLNQLPKSISKAHHLVSLELDGSNYIYPPADIAEADTETIKRFICEDTGTEYVAPSEVKDENSEAAVAKDTLDDGFHAKIWELENIKQQRTQQFLEIEKENELLQQQEFQLASAQRIHREKLLADITQEQQKFDLQLTRLQLEKEAERFKLMEQLHEEEQNADIAIKQLLSVNREPLSQLLEQEKLEEQRILAATAKHNEALRRDDILRTMQDMLQQETARFQQFDKDRFEANRNILEQETRSNNQLSKILQNQDFQKAELLSRLLEDDELQKIAVATLLERGDARSWSLIQQVKMVEAQLAALTHIELDRRKLDVDHQLNDLAEKRINLSILLLDLLEKQKERRKELLDTLEKIETKKQDEDFWLKQYQILLDRLPAGLAEAQKNMNPALAQALLSNGVLHCLPFLAKLTQDQRNIDDITENNLYEAGIVNRVDRVRVMDAFRMFRKELALDAPISDPSTSNVPVETASAPPLDYVKCTPENECIICMDEECQVVFVPCGHLACCNLCSQCICDCPLCRCEIERKIYIVP